MPFPRLLVVAALFAVAGCRCGTDPDEMDGGTAGGSAGGSAGGMAGGAGGGVAGGSAGGAAGGTAGGAAGGTAGGAAGGTAGGAAGGTAGGAAGGTAGGAAGGTAGGAAGGTAGGAAGGTAGGSAGGTADAGECMMASSCPGSDSECRARTCIGGACGVRFTDAGIPVAMQATGDCRRNECDGDGGVIAAAFDSDLPNDMQQCTGDTCVAGMPTFSPVPINSPCSQGGAVCDALGNCVQCTQPSQCGATTQCRSYQCTLNLCAFTNASFGTQTSSQTPNDCLANVCDGDGGTTVGDDDSDVPVDDGNDCTNETCSMGMPQHPSRPQDSACDGGVCSPMAACVQCNSPAQCGATTECASRTCASNTCVVAFTDAGAPVTSQAPGDCRENQCDGDGGVMSAVLDTDLPPPAMSVCTAPACTAGAPAFPPLDAGTVCMQMGGVACDGFGVCQPPPQVVSTSPADSSTPVAGPTLSVTFNVPMSASSLTAQTAEGPCSGSVQVSLDAFASCIAFASASGTMSAGDTTVTFTAAPGLLVNRNYRIRVTTTATGANGVPMAAQYDQAAGFTTTSPNLCTGSLVISQIYGGSGSTAATFTSDYVELHNRGPTPIPLTGITVQYASAGGNFTFVAPATTDGGVIAPGAYHLIVMSTNTGLAPIPVPADQTNASQIAMNATTGKVVLVNGTAPLGATCSGANVIDQVSYGAGTSCAETVTAPAPSNTMAIFRAANGCGDINDNSRDFTTGAPLPRNSASPAQACACTIMNESNAPLEADYCNVQFPNSITAQTNTGSGLVYGQLFEAGTTEATDGGAPNVRAQLGFGPPTANPQYQPGWTWTNAVFNVQIGNNDEYQNSFVVPAPGSYRYVYRFSLDNGVSWTLCDRNLNDFGAGSNPNLSFEFADEPVLTSTP